MFFFSLNWFLFRRRAFNFDAQKVIFLQDAKQITVLLFKKIKKFIHKLCMKEFRKLDKMIQIKAYYDKEQKYR